MTSEKYKDISEANLLSDFPLLKGTKSRRDNLYYMHDNVKPHGGSIVKQWFQENHVYVLDWPSYSPDLNPIENVWGFMRGELFKYNTTLTSADEAWEKTKEI